MAESFGRRVMMREKISPSCVDNVGRELRSGDRVLVIMAADRKLAYQRGRFHRQIEAACPEGFGFHVAILRGGKKKKVVDPSMKGWFPFGLSRKDYFRKLLPPNREQTAFLFELTPQEFKAHRGNSHKLKVLALLRERKSDLDLVTLGGISSLRERTARERSVFPPPLRHSRRGGDEN